MELREQQRHRLGGRSEPAVLRSFSERVIRRKHEGRGKVMAVEDELLQATTVAPERILS